MASPPSPVQTLRDKSYFKPTVILYDWWLVKSEETDRGRRLAVAGVSSVGQEARRLFSSAPISKIYDVFTLETSDGVCIILKGVINKQQTIQNGFPDEIPKRFLFGFPASWERCVAEFLEGDSNTPAVSGRISNSDKFSTRSESKKSYSPTSVHFSQEETPHEQASRENRHDAEVETNKENIGSTYFQCVSRPKSLKGNQKHPVSGCSMKHKSTTFISSSQCLDEASGAAIQSGGKMDILDRCRSNSACRASRFLSEFLRSKGTNQQMVGNGLNSEKKQKTTDSVLTVSETINNILQNDNCELGGKGVQISGPTSVHSSQEEEPHEQVSCEDMHDVEVQKQLSSKLSLNRNIDDSKSDDLVNHVTEEETDKENVGSGRLTNLEGNQNPDSGSPMKHDTTKFSPSSDAGVASGVTIQSGGEIDISERYPRNSAGRVPGNLSIITRSKSKKKTIVGNGLNSEQNTIDSVPAVETVSNTSQNDDFEVGGRGVINSSPSFVHFAQENPHKKVHCEDRLDVEVAKQFSMKLSSDGTIDDLKVDDLMNHAAEEETDNEKIGSIESLCVGRPKTIEENVKNPASGFSMKYKITKSGPVSEAIESLDVASDATDHSGGKMDISEGSPSHFAGRVSQLFSGIIRRKGKKKGTVGNGLNFETNTIDSVSAATDTVSNMLQNDSCEAGGNGMSRPSDSELQEPMDVNLVRKLDFDFVEDDMQQTSNAKEGHDCGNVTAQVGEGQRDAKEENTSSKITKRKLTIDTQETYSTLEVNKKKKASPSTLGVNKGKRGVSPSTLKVNNRKKGTPSIPEVNKKKKFILSTLEMNKKNNITPSTLMVKKKINAPTTPEVNKRKVSPSTLEVNNKKKLTPSTVGVNKKEKVISSTLELKKKKNVTSPTPEVKKKRKVSSSTLEVNKKKKPNPLTLETNKEKEVTFSTPKVMKMTIISPESLSVGRSRSGRLCLPPLEFWRNQSPIYDVDHGVTGIQEELPIVTPSRGTRSDSQKRKPNRG
ncbi:hypothetical protein M0R45_029240 [Rubus argutus]|uniref:SANTA domain-containing protein n=1 Tax=Rubus argutus TaxID=59490 RepID=A0AAW1W7L9_RUBAR